MSLQLEEEKKIFDEIVQIFPVEGVPEIIAEQVAHNPFDKNLIFHNALEKGIREVQKILESVLEVTFEIEDSDHAVVGLIISPKESLCMPKIVYEKINHYLLTAGYDKVTRQVRNVEEITFRLPLDTSRNSPGNLSWSA